MKKNILKYIDKYAKREYNNHKKRKMRIEWRWKDANRGMQCASSKKYYRSY